MGWKNVKTHYRIEHIVEISDGLLKIGSSFVPGLIEVHPDGTVKWGKLGESENEELKRYYKEMSADKDLLKKLLNSPDVFLRELPVWFYENGELVEKKCEDYGWPNLTYDGLIMYDNVFFKTRNDAVEKAKRELASHIGFLLKEKASKENELKEISDSLVELENERRKLNDL